MRKFFFIFLSISVFTKVQSQSYWPIEIKLIPDLEVEIYSLDKAHSKLNFSIDYFGFSDVVGSFDNYNGTVLYNEEDILKTSITLLVNSETINTGSEFRDKDLQTEAFFDSQKFKFIKFQSKYVIKTEEGSFFVGELTMKGITKEIKVPFKRTRTRFMDSFWGNINIGFKGELVINRMDFDIHGGKWGDKVLSKDVKISFSIVAKQPNTMKWGNPDMSKKISSIVEIINSKGVSNGKKLYIDIIESGFEINAFNTNIIAKRLMQQYYFKDAIEFLEFAKNKFPRNRSNYTDIARSHLFLGNETTAKKLYTELIETSSVDTEAMEILKLLNN